MLRFLLFFMCLFSMFSAISQASMPDSVTWSASAMGEWVKTQNKPDLLKYRLVYNWITTHITYNTDSSYAINFSLNTKDMISAVLRRRSGVCENYAALFNEVCNQAGLNSFMVQGYTRQQGTVDRAAHCWNAVELQGTWFLCDPTWGVGGGEKYFMVSPPEMINSHMPFDPMWQLLPYPLSPQAFANGSGPSSRGKLIFNFADSIAFYKNLDSLEKLENTGRREAHIFKANELAVLNEKQNNMHVEMIRQDRDVEAYNIAVGILNDCKKKYNHFITYRNNLFIPEESGDIMFKEIDLIQSGLFSAEKQLKKIAESNSNYKFDLDEIQDNINNLKMKLQQQSAFISLYLKTAEKDRVKLFYKE